MSTDRPLRLQGPKLDFKPIPNVSDVPGSLDEALERLPDGTDRRIGRVVFGLAVNPPYGEGSTPSLYCTCCGAIQRADDQHLAECPYRTARELLGLPTDWPRCAPACPACKDAPDA